MLLKLMNCSYPVKMPEGVPALRFWISPDEKHVVAEVFHAEYFAAGRITEYDPEAETMTVECVDSFSADGDETDFRSYSVDWEDMQYGFCKLKSRELESYKLRVYRIYFDPELYRRKCEEMHGNPKDGKDS